MKYLKRTHLNSKTVTGRNSVYVDISGEVVVDSPYSLLLPRGDNEHQSPDDSTFPTYVNGMIRYNTETDQFEGYQAGAWRSFRFKEPGYMDVHYLGTGDGIETTFALPYDPFAVTPQNNMPWNANQIAKNLIFLVENVFQIANVNYIIEQNPLSGPGAPYNSGIYVVFGSPVPSTKNVYLLTGFDQ